MSQRLSEAWKLASSLLNFELIMPFDIKFSDGRSLRAEFLVQNFGGKNGMLVFKSYPQIRQYINEIEIGGYGFSILDEPAPDEKFVLDDYINILKDWGWAGTEIEKPLWL